MDSPKREAENMKERGYVWIFSIATGMTGKNKSLFSLLNGKVSFDVMSAKRQRLNKKLWQVGCPGFLTKMLMMLLHLLLLLIFVYGCEISFVLARELSLSCPDSKNLDYPQ